jgi:polysaccharide biosynthesis/export protein
MKFNRSTFGIKAITGEGNITSMIAKHRGRMARQGLCSAMPDFSKRIALTILALIWLILSASSINAQQKLSVPQEPSEPGNAGVLPLSDTDYQISAGDVIQLQIEDAPELSHFYRVNSIGYIEMPVLGLIAVQKNTTYELARVIAKGLRDADYLKMPNVLVTIKQYYSQTFFVQGSVRNPGVYQTEGHPSLLTMIGLAGGLAVDHGSTVFILRPNKSKKPEPTGQGKETANRQGLSTQDQTADAGLTAQFPDGPGDSTANSDYDLIKVNLGMLYKGQADQRLEPGDIINIPRADVFFVAGEVRAPGSFTLKDGTTLRQAISLAQGMTFNAKAGKGVIFREDPTHGSRLEIKIDVGAIMNGKMQDVPVMANDVIIVPNSRSKSIGSVLLMAFGLNAARYPVRN